MTFPLPLLRLCRCHQAVLMSHQGCVDVISSVLMSSGLSYLASTGFFLSPCLGFISPARIPAGPSCLLQTSGDHVAYQNLRIFCPFYFSILLLEGQEVPSTLWLPRPAPSRRSGDLASSWHFLFQLCWCLTLKDRSYSFQGIPCRVLAVTALSQVSRPSSS